MFDTIFNGIDSFFAGWCGTLTGGWCLNWRESLYGETARQNHSGIAFEIGHWVGSVHTALMFVLGAYNLLVTGSSMVGGGTAVLELAGGGTMTVTIPATAVAIGEVGINVAALAPMYMAATGPGYESEVPRVVRPPSLEDWEIKAIMDKIEKLVNKLKTYPRDPSWNEWLNEVQDLYAKLGRGY